jgi:hypothetical protein
MTGTEIQNVPGAQQLVDWFGRWPSFHDAEVLSIHLNRSGFSSIRLHTWDMTDQVDPKGFYILRKHVVVSFTLEGLRDIELSRFSVQNVVSELNLIKTNDGFQLDLGPCYGVAGSLTASSIRIEFTPGVPPESAHRFQE